MYTGSISYGNVGLGPSTVTHVPSSELRELSDAYPKIKNITLDTRDALYPHHGRAEFLIPLTGDLKLNPKKNYKLKVSSFKAEFKIRRRIPGNEEAYKKQDDNLNLMYLVSRKLAMPQTHGPRSLEIIAPIFGNKSSGSVMNDGEAEEVDYWNISIGSYSATLNPKYFRTSSIFDFAITDRFGEALTDEIVDLDVPIIIILRLSPTS